MSSSVWPVTSVALGAHLGLDLELCCEFSSHYQMLGLTINIGHGCCSISARAVGISHSSNCAMLLEPLFAFTNLILNVYTEFVVWPRNLPLQ